MKKLLLVALLAMFVGSLTSPVRVRAEGPVHCSPDPCKP